VLGMLYSILVCSSLCWMIRDPLVVQKISLLEIISTCSAATSYGCRSSGVFYAVDSATLQPVHRCTPAPYGILAVPAALPTHCALAPYLRTGQTGDDINAGCIVIPTYVDSHLQRTVIS